MVRTLIVDDDQAKARKIAETLRSVEDFSGEWISFASNVFEAKRLLRNQQFEFLVLDIALPPRHDKPAERLAGVQLLKDVIARPDRYHVPAHVVGVTGFDDIHAQVASEFSGALLTLLRYDVTSSDWAHALSARAKHLVLADATQQRGEPRSADLAIVCALYSPELLAVLNLDWNWSQFTVEGDHSLYWRGQFRSGTKVCSVVATHAPRIGMVGASAPAWKLIATFRPRVLAMTGITAGVRGKVQLGDVVVADPCWDWGSGKWIAVEGDRLFQPSVHQIPLSVDVREQFRLMAQDVGALARIKHSWQADKPNHELAIHVGPLASGAAVLADGTTVDSIMLHNRGLLAVEMEAYSLYAAASECAKPRPTAIVAKAVVDFADSEKADKMQRYGSYTSAAALKLWAEQHMA